VQIARLLGAHVTAVCGASSFDLVRGLGAQEVIDYQTTDFATGSQTFDVILDAVGNRPHGQCKRVLSGRRVHVTTTPGVGTFIRQFINPLAGMKVFALITTGNGDDLAEIAGMVERGQLRPVIDKVYPFDQVAAAQEYSKARRAKGKIVLQL
jgi:NADPH:quinone reductase-like Zn-dependent oxidoreductase